MVYGKGRQAPLFRLRIRLRFGWHRTLLATTALCLWRPPGAEGVFGEVAGLAFGGQVGFGGALAEGLVQLVVPLADPGHDLQEAGQQRGQAVGVPAVRRAALLDQADQGGGLVLVVPACPADEQGVFVAVGARAWVGDEMLLGHGRRRGP
jgi:hypothetical protein